MVDRIKKVMDTFGLTPMQFAEELGISRSNLTHIFNKRNQPSLDLTTKLLKSFPEIKTEWLILGVGDMMRSDDEVAAIKQKENLKKQSNTLDLFSQIDEPLPDNDEPELDEPQVIVPEKLDIPDVDNNFDTQMVENEIIDENNEDNSVVDEPEEVIPDLPEPRPIVEKISPVKSERHVASDAMSSYSSSNAKKSIPKAKKVISAGESRISKEMNYPPELFNSRNDKTVVKIVFFYSDNSFEIYHNS